ncbi:hypothetical protein EXW59_16825 [Bacillus mycoides]|nr:hypothetical protein EXW59_16825 [Bacillus mycoides]QWI43330.1 hypothetical protein EXW55_10080 [Bacillus mycoides]
MQNYVNELYIFCFYVENCKKRCTFVCFVRKTRYTEVKMVGFLITSIVTRSQITRLLNDLY